MWFLPVRIVQFAAADLGSGVIGEEQLRLFAADIGAIEGTHPGTLIGVSTIAGVARLVLRPSTGGARPARRDITLSVHACLLPHIASRVLMGGEPDAALRLHVVDQPFQRDDS